MTKKPKKLADKGADSARELYELVGVSLSYWEASEDAVLGLFRNICQDIEPVATEAFIHGPRHVRNSMLRFAMETYRYRFTESEIEVIDTALKELDKLASIRNEIAHGCVSNYKSEVDGQTVASGNYLLPSFNEGGIHERNFRFHHTPETIHSFIEMVRKWGRVIQDVSIAMVMRTQEQKFFGPIGPIFMNLVTKISRLEIRGYDAVNQMKKILQYDAADRSEANSSNLN